MWHGIRTRCLLWFPLTHPSEPGAATSLPAPAGPGLVEPGRTWSHPSGRFERRCLPKASVWLPIKLFPLYFPSVSVLSQDHSPVTHQLLAPFTLTQPRPNLLPTASNASSYGMRAGEDLELKKHWDEATTRATRRRILLQPHSKSKKPKSWVGEPLGITILTALSPRKGD